MVGWHHRLNGHRVWVNSGSWWWTGKPGMLQSMGSQRGGHNWATELNWITSSHTKKFNPSNSHHRTLDCIKLLSVVGWTVRPPPKYVHLNQWIWPHLGKGSFKCKNLKIILNLGWTPNPINVFLWKTETGDTLTPSEEGRAKMTAETGVMQPHTKQWLEPQEAGREARQGSYPEPLKEKETVNTLILDLWALELWENKMVVFQATKITVIFFSSPGKLIHWDIF